MLGLFLIYFAHEPFLWYKMCRGPFKRICHWGPITALAIIKVITFAAVHCCSMWWPPDGSAAGFLHLCVFLLFSGLTLYHFLSAMYVGPGYLPPGWMPEVTEHCEFLQFCNTCEGFKAPRTHHCRKCGRCVQKMDHHCPWINNCVGHRNHAHFTAFLFFAVCGCLQATVVLGCSLYRALNRVWYLYYGTGAEPMVYLSVWMLVLCVFSLGLAIGVVLAVGMLLVIQLRGIHRNRTAVEDWIVEKARARRGAADPPFVHPYDLGWRDNCRQVLSCSCDPRGDGLSWPVRDGCDQFTITREQKQQKLEKRQRTRVYTVHTPFSGAWFPVSHGWQVLCHPPFTDESRIRLRRGDTIHVTRWRRHWLFGEKVAPGTEDGSDSASRVRGWFPRACVCEVMDGTADSADKKVN